jgi:hypothetical protein
MAYTPRPPLRSTANSQASSVKAQLNALIEAILDPKVSDDEVRAMVNLLKGPRS